MKPSNKADGPCLTAADEADTLDALLPLVTGRVAHGVAAAYATNAIGDLVAIRDDGTPLVLVERHADSRALPARSIIDIHSGHVGRQVVLFFEDGDPSKPVVLGVIRDSGTRVSTATAGHVDIDADGERLVVSARERLVLQCGKASITLTKTGKVIIQGAYVSNRSSGVLRMKGGSVQIN